MSKLILTSHLTFLCCPLLSATKTIGLLKRLDFLALVKRDQDIHASSNIKNLQNRSIQQWKELCSFKGIKDELKSNVLHDTPSVMCTFTAFLPRNRIQGNISKPISAGYNHFQISKVAKTFVLHGDPNPILKNHNQPSHLLTHQLKGHEAEDPVENKKVPLPTFFFFQLINSSSSERNIFITNLIRGFWFFA